MTPRQREVNQFRVTIQNVLTHRLSQVPDSNVRLSARFNSIGYRNSDLKASSNGRYPSRDRSERNGTVSSNSIANIAEAKLKQKLYSGGSQPLINQPGQEDMAGKSPLNLNTIDQSGEFEIGVGKKVVKE